jgi:hypothetical protein
MRYNRPHDVSRSPGDDDRLAAALHGEVAATTVEAYRRAGASAYQDMMGAEQLRGSLAASGAGLWAASAGQSSQLLCAWNAFALQPRRLRPVEPTVSPCSAAGQTTDGMLPY